MFQMLRHLLLGLAFLCVTLPQRADAIVTRIQFPLSGHRGYLAARGLVICEETRGETDRDDGTTVVIEVSNVPLPPGTELLVFVHEAEVGSLVLDKDQNGRLVLETKFRQPAPKIKAGSFVTLQLADGSIVIW